ncbi:sodium-dependent multivitamin transporter-like, partial [Physella acuta]|uniref:sodium-dependent multivitamin transporter-like n=1 Tax=Physella acuta TaxID=109671 RepID=UPI0027DBD61A
MSVFGLMLGALLAAIFVVPLLFPLKLTSSFDYLEQRFKSRYARLVGTFLMMLSQTIYMGITCYGPATALKAVTGFPLWATILSIGAVATFYSALGGIKAVIWTDVFQAVMMLAGLLAVVIQGTLKVGGASRVWSLNDRWERIQFF